MQHVNTTSAEGIKLAQSWGYSRNTLREQLSTLDASVPELESIPTGPHAERVQDALADAITALETVLDIASDHGAR